MIASTRMLRQGRARCWAEGCGAGRRQQQRGSPRKAFRQGAAIATHTAGRAAARARGGGGVSEASRVHAAQPARPAAIVLTSRVRYRHRVCCAACCARRGAGGACAGACRARMRASERFAASRGQSGRAERRFVGVRRDGEPLGWVGESGVKTSRARSGRCAAGLEFQLCTCSCPSTQLSRARASLAGDACPGCRQGPSCAPGGSGHCEGADAGACSSSCDRHPTRYFIAHSAAAAAPASGRRDTA
jgi:hypothetical protein